MLHLLGIKLCALFLISPWFQKASLYMYLSKRIVISYAVWFPVSKRGQGEWVTAPQWLWYQASPQGVLLGKKGTLPPGPTDTHQRLPWALQFLKATRAPQPRALAALCGLCSCAEGAAGKLNWQGRWRKAGKMEESYFLLGVNYRGTPGNPQKQSIYLKS